jgi:hypothetical protein
VPEGSTSYRIRTAAPALLLVLVILAPPIARAQSGVGTIRGQLFTAQHLDSVAGGAELTLIYRQSASEPVERMTTTAGEDGTYLFTPVSPDPAIAYVIKVHHFGRDFLGAPMSFEPGSSLLEFNFLVSRDAQPVPQSDGHPPMEDASDSHAHEVERVRQDPLAAVAIVGGVLTLFALPFLAGRSRGSGNRERRVEGAAADLMRDIASLDLRFAEGDLEESDYRSVRASLFEKLEERTGAARPASRRSR